LSRQHAQLPAMVRLVRNEVTQKVGEISWKVLPCGWWDRTASSCAELDQFNNPAVAAFERARQLRGLYSAPINSRRHRDSVGHAYHLDPHTPGIMNMRHNHPHRPPRHTGNTLPPQLCRQIPNKIHRHAMARPPRINQRLCRFRIFRHDSLLITDLPRRGVGQNNAEGVG